MRVLTLLLFSFGLMASTPWRSSVIEVLPRQISQLRPNKTTLKEAVALMGKADLVEGENHYWARDGLKYALQLTFNKNKILSSLHYTFTKNKPSLKSFEGKIDVNKFTPFPKEGKSAGRYLIFKEKDAELMIDPISKTIRSVKLK